MVADGCIGGFVVQWPPRSPWPRRLSRPRPCARGATSRSSPHTPPAPPQPLLTPNAHLLVRLFAGDVAAECSTASSPCTRGDERARPSNGYGTRRSAMRAARRRATQDGEQSLIATRAREREEGRDTPQWYRTRHAPCVVQRELTRDAMRGVGVRAAATRTWWPSRRARRSWRLSASLPSKLWPW
jgi:hypothetical protein